MKKEVILSKEEIDLFKSNKELISSELLELLRNKGNEGKRIALEILDTEKNDRRYYMDASGFPISFDGNKAIKKPGTLMNLSSIHMEEIKKCSDDFNYFRMNYIQIKTQKGVDFPEIRDYQQRLITAMLEDKNEEVVGLIGRQCIHGDSILDLEDISISIKQLFDDPSLGLL